MKKIAVLALQGAFIEHEEMIKSLDDVEVFEIRKKEDWQHHNDKTSTRTRFVERHSNCNI